MWRSAATLATVLLLPLAVSAQTPPADATAPAAAAPPAAAAAPAAATPDEASSGGIGKRLVITAGVVSGLVIADVVTGGALTGPLLEAVGYRSAAPAASIATAPLTAGQVEARQAGAVLGEQIVGATDIRDAAARRDVLWGGTLALSALGGGWLFSQFTR